MAVRKYSEYSSSMSEDEQIEDKMVSNSIRTCISEIHLAVLKRRLDLIKLLVDYGANVNEKEEHSGMTPLHLAVDTKNAEITKYLIDKGADLNALTKSRIAPIHLAIKNKDDKILKMLLDKNANIFLARCGKLPLDFAIENCAVSCVRLLKKKETYLSTNREMLEYAIKERDVEIVKYLLEKGVQEYSVNSDDYFLKLAIKTDCKDIIKLFLRAKGETTDAVRRLLNSAFQQQKKDLVRTFLECNVDPNLDLDVFKNKPIHMAVGLEWTDIVELLVEKGADVSAVNVKNCLPLHIAVEKNYESLALYLLSQGTEVNVQQVSTGFTPLHTAVKNGHLNLVLNLLERGADYSILSNAGDSPMDFAFNGVIRFDSNPAKKEADPLFSPAERYNRRVKILQQMLLFQDMYDQAWECNDHMKVFMIAIKQKNLKIIEMLLRFGADPNYTHLDIGTSPLQLAVSTQYEECVNVLLQNKVNVNYVRGDGLTALDMAVKTKNFELVTQLLENGASLCKNKLAAIKVALYYRWYNVVDALLRIYEEGWVASYPELILNCINNLDVEMLKLLMDHGADVQAPRYAYQILSLAIEKKLPEAVEVILSRGVDSSLLNRRNDNNDTLLHVALRLGEAHISRMLIKLGACIYRLDGNNKTSLHLAAAAGCISMMQLILSKNLHVDIPDGTNRTPLFDAVTSEKYESVKFLLSHGADCNVECDGELYSVLHFALDNIYIYPEITELLLLNGARLHAKNSVDSSLKTAYEYGIVALKRRNLELAKLSMEDTYVFFDSLESEVTYTISEGKLYIDGKYFLCHQLPVDIEEFFEECYAEILRSKSTIMFNNTSLYDVLTMTDDQLTNQFIGQVKNNTIVNSFLTKSVASMYPIYCDYLVSKLEKAMSIHSSAQLSSEI